MTDLEICAGVLLVSLVVNVFLAVLIGSLTSRKPDKPAPHNPYEVDCPGCGRKMTKMAKELFGHCSICMDFISGPL